MPTITEMMNMDSERLGAAGRMNALYERLVRDSGAVPAAWPDNMGATARAVSAPSGLTFDPAGYMGNMTWTNHAPQQYSDPQGVDVPAPTSPYLTATYETPPASAYRATAGASLEPRIAANPVYYDEVPPPLSPYPDIPVSATRTGRRARELRDDSEETRMGEFRSHVRGVLREDRDSGFGGRDYLKGLTRGELVNAAKAYEHLRPELWPFNGARRFIALEMTEWNRTVRAASFLEQECRRLGEDDLEAIRDAEHEIRRLAIKAVELRWPKRVERDERNSGAEIDPF